MRRDNTVRVMARPDRPKYSPLSRGVASLKAMTGCVKNNRDFFGTIKIGITV